MSRAVRPAKLHSELYRDLAKDTSDGFGSFVMNCVSIGGTGVAIGMTAGISVYFWLLALIPILFLMFTISFFKNTEPIQKYDKTLYDRAYGQVVSIREPDTFADARELATNIWKHEQIVMKVGENHEAGYHCRDCQNRLDLIVDLKNNQPLPEIDGSDIERIEAKLKARTKIANDDRRMLSA